MSFNLPKLPIANFMRDVINPQMSLDSVDIGAIHLDPRSRDDIPQILRGLQHIYTDPALRERVFAILQEVIPNRADGKGKANANMGRPGMEQWRILVLGVVRLGLNADFDRIHELANQHSTLRQMLGHSDWTDKTDYKVQTLKDNLRLFTPELLDRINQAVVDAGHVLVKKKAPEEGLGARCDSFVVETHVHYPTDINLLWDAIRKTIEISADLCQAHGLSDWRQSAFNLRQFKKLYRHAQKLKHSTSKDEVKQQDKAAAMQQAHRAYLEQAKVYLDRASDTRRKLQHMVLAEAFLGELDEFMRHAERQIDQIERRVLQGQTIPHEEKVFSLFQPHTEWISKVRREVAFIIVSPTHKVGDETGRSVGRSLPVHASLATTAYEATGTTCRAFGPRSSSARKRRHLRASMRVRCQAQWHGQQM